MSRLVGTLLTLLLVLPAGCGYHFPGRGNSLPADVHSLRIPLFKNMTPRPFLENTVSNDVLLRFTRVPGLQVVDQGGDAQLEGTVTSTAPFRSPTAATTRSPSIAPRSPSARPSSALIPAGCSGRGN